MKEEQRRDQLKRAVVSLALDAERQLALWPPGPWGLPEGLVTEFDIAWRAGRDLVGDTAPLDSLDEAIAILEQGVSPDSWYRNEWVMGPEWAPVRAAARHVAQTMAWSLEENPWDNVTVLEARSSRQPLKKRHPMIRRRWLRKP